MHRQHFAAPFALCLIAGLATAVTGRLIENWPYDRLFREADVVVIAVAEKTAETQDRFDPKIWTTQFIGQSTTFVVASTLKGKAEKKLEVLHYKVPPNALLENGPLLVTFRTEPIRIERPNLQARFGPPEYLLFLKRLPDGRLAPVSGAIDPELSVREIYSPLPAVFEK